MRRRIGWVVAGISGAVLTGVPVVAFAGQGPAANLQVLTPGGVFLANIDDDGHACQVTARKITKAAVAREEQNDERFQAAKDKLQAEPDEAKAEREFLKLRRAHRLEQNLADRQMAACNDAADTVVNGAADEQDLARLQVAPWPDAPDGATGRLTVTGNVHVFVKRARWDLAAALTTDELRRGVVLGLEGRDVVRDRKVWDGSATVTLTVTAGNEPVSHSVRLHEAPVLTQLNTQRLQRVLAAPARSDNGKAWRAATGAALPKGVDLTEIDTGGDDWMQDLFEPTYQVMPGLNGGQHGMRVLIPSVNDMHRQAARITYTQLKGPDVAVVHVSAVPRADIDDTNTYDSMGNLETMPPTPGRPNGTVLFGGDPSPEIVGFFRAQTVQPVSIVDTMWLTIGHVDEFVQFLPVSDGWKAIVADPQAGLALLREVRAAGHGGEKLHGNLPTLEWPYDERIDQRAVDEFLRDQQFVDTNRIAAERIDKNLRKLGLDPDRVVRVPMLFTARSVDWGIAKSAADQLPPGPEHDKAVADLDAMRQGVGEIPNLINGLVVGLGRYIAPQPYGTLLGGKDLFAAALDQSLGKLGYHVTYVDDLTSAHVSEGEIHCSTNTFRSYT